MVDFLEGFELTNNIRLDWGYASRVVLFFFYQLQQAAQQPNQVQNMKGQPRLLVAADRPGEWLPTLHSLGEWISFMSEALCLSARLILRRKKCGVETLRRCRRNRLALSVWRVPAQVQ